MRDDIPRHCAEIDRCNQRGGRMLSVVDLIDAGTIDVGLAAFSLAAIGAGASFLVGAKPGGAGKTTVMGALLNFVPAGVTLRAADGEFVRSTAVRRAVPGGSRAGIPPDGGTTNEEHTRAVSGPVLSPRRCYICHEIGPGGYYAYLWGEPLRAYFAWAAGGHMLATNLHADTYEQARAQIVDDNAVPEDALRRMNLMFFLSVARGPGVTRRRIVSVWESDGRSPHRLLWPDAGDGAADGLASSALAAPSAQAAARVKLDALLASGARTIEQVRTHLLNSR
jgi:hypothetical protein